MGGLEMRRKNKTGGFMKKNLVVMSFVVVIGMMAGFALAGETMSVNVPFDFYMGEQLCPAGEYHFKMNHGNSATASVVNVWAPESSSDRILMTTASNEESQTANQLRFNKYGKKLFLSTVSINGHKATLKPINLENELRIQAAHASGSITVAQK